MLFTIEQIKMLYLINEILQKSKDFEDFKGKVNKVVNEFEKTDKRPKGGSCGECLRNKEHCLMLMNEGYKTNCPFCIKRKELE